MDKLNINQWAAEDRPREKLMRLGAQALTDAELLAILVGSGSTKEDALAALDAVYMPARYGYLDADSAAAFRYISRAWEVMGHGA